MRPHVELIQEADLCWHPAELIKGSGTGVKQRNLSYDEEDGSASMRVLFDKPWSRPAGYHSADVEWYVVEGRIRIGDRYLGKGVQKAVGNVNGSIRDSLLGADAADQRALDDAMRRLASAVA